jgi:TRAP-type transport system periplasmic protein
MNNKTQKITPTRSKRLFFAACASLLLASAASGTRAAEAIEIKVSHYLPPQHTINKELTRWAEELGTKSQGRLKVSVFPSGQMGPINRQFDLARTGVADAAFLLHGALPGRFPLTELAQLPYVFNPDSGSTMKKALNNADASAILTGMRADLAKEHAGTRILYLIASPTISLLFDRPGVRSPADLRGLRIRHNGPASAKMIEAWGATPAAVAPVELADALAKGTINGMTLTYEGARAFQVGPAVKSVAEVNAYAITFALVINDKKYQSLPADLRQLIDDSTGVEAARRIGGEFDKAEAAGRQYLIDSKAEIYVPTAEDQKAFRNPVLPLVNEALTTTAAAGHPSRKFYDTLRERVNGLKP